MLRGCGEKHGIGTMPTKGVSYLVHRSFEPRVSTLSALSLLILRGHLGSEVR